MRSRTLSTVLAAALVAAGAAALVAQPASAAGEKRLFLRSKAGSYQADAQADPSAVLTGKSPAGSTLSLDAPTSATSATGDAIDPIENQPGIGVSFKVPAGLVVSTICLDVYIAATDFDLSVYMQTGPSFSQAGGAGDYVTFKGVPVKGTAAVNRVTASTAIVVADSAGPTIKTLENTSLVFSTLHAPNKPYKVHYNSTVAPSSVIFNSPTCTPALFPTAAAAPAAPGPAATTAGAAPTSAAAEPSAEASESASAAPSGPAGPAGPNCAGGSGGSGEPSADPSASAEPTTTTTAAPAESASAEPSASPPAGGGSSNDATSCRVKSVSLRTSATQITAGNAPLLTGVARDERGDAVEGATITIFTKGYGESRYTPAATVRTDSAGQYKIAVRPMKQTTLGANVGDAKSTTLSIAVSTRVNISAPAPSTVSNPVTFTGSLTPGYARVAVGLGYVVNGRFVVLTQVNTDGAGRYTITSRLPRGTHPFVLYTSAHQGTGKGSRSVKLTVR